MSDEELKELTGEVLGLILYAQGPKVGIACEDAQALLNALARLTRERDEAIKTQQKVALDALAAEGQAFEQVQKLSVQLEEALMRYHECDGMEGAVTAAIRDLLIDCKVPLAAFIDDHVGSAIAQRNQAWHDIGILLAQMDTANEGRADPLWVGEDAALIEGIRTTYANLTRRENANG